MLLFRPEMGKFGQPLDLYLCSSWQWLRDISTQTQHVTVCKHSVLKCIFKRILVDTILREFWREWIRETHIQFLSLLNISQKSYLALIGQTNRFHNAKSLADGALYKLNFDPECDIFGRRRQHGVFARGTQLELVIAEALEVSQTLQAACEKSWKDNSKSYTCIRNW